MVADRLSRTWDTPRNKVGVEILKKVREALAISIDCGDLRRQLMEQIMPGINARGGVVEVRGQVGECGVDRGRRQECGAAVAQRASAAATDRLKTPGLPVQRDTNLERFADHRVEKNAVTRWGGRNNGGMAGS